MCRYTWVVSEPTSADLRSPTVDVMKWRSTAEDRGDRSCSPACLHSGCSPTRSALFSLLRHDRRRRNHAVKMETAVEEEMDD
jgi:hypothetical protein